MVRKTSWEACREEDALIAWQKTMIINFIYTILVPLTKKTTNGTFELMKFLRRPFYVRERELGEDLCEKVARRKFMPAFIFFPESCEGKPYPIQRITLIKKLSSSIARVSMETN